MKNFTVFSMKIPVDDPKKMKAFTEAMNKLQDSLQKYLEDVQKELNIPKKVAIKIVKLRASRNWTQKKQNRLIRDYRKTLPTKSTKTASNKKK